MLKCSFRSLTSRRYLEWYLGDRGAQNFSVCFGALAQWLLEPSLCHTRDDLLSRPAEVILLAFLVETRASPRADAENFGDKAFLQACAIPIHGYQPVTNRNVGRTHLRGLFTNNPQVVCRFFFAVHANGRYGQCVGRPQRACAVATALQGPYVAWSHAQTRELRLPAIGSWQTFN